jgi:uncharacterized tellurite resistance protein B-like protein
MKKTDDEPGSRKISVSPKTALYIAALSVIAADGSIVNAETGDMGKIVRGDKENFDIACKILANSSYEDCVNLVACALTEQQQVALIAILLDLAMADGILANTEERLISSYVVKFGIPFSVFKDLCHYISLKNNISLFE